MQKRVIAVHDISCVGRCSITVALPVISAAGIECSVIPTALLSTHTGGFRNYTFLPLTDEMGKIASHLKTLNRPADTVYTGYLGSPEQIGAAESIVSDLLKDGGTAVVDPVMGDSGRFYSGFDKQMADAMRRLCERASVILPNITEACLLLDEEYPGNAPSPGKETERILRKLSNLGPGSVVLTGVESDGQIGAAYYDRSGNKSGIVLGKKYPGFYHGTGDVFGSALTAALTLGADLADAVAEAVGFTESVVSRTLLSGEDTRYGPIFEPELAEFSKKMRAITENSGKADIST